MPAEVRRQRILEAARRLIGRGTRIPVRPPRELIDAAVRANLRALFGLAWDHADTILAALRSRNTEPAADAVVRRIEARLIAALQEDLRAGQRAALIDVADVDLAARCLFAGLEALVEHGLLNRDHVDIDQLVDTAAHLQLHGILVPS